MKSATIHPTPQRVVDAIQVVAAWLREIDAAEAVVSPKGGASFHPERQADRLLGEWGLDRERLFAVLAEYGQHKQACDWQLSGCTCGLDEALRGL